MFTQGVTRFILSCLSIAGLCLAVHGIYFCSNHAILLTQEELSSHYVGLWGVYCPSTTAPCPSCTPAAACAKANHHDRPAVPGDTTGWNGGVYFEVLGTTVRRWNCPPPSGGGCSFGATCARSRCAYFGCTCSNKRAACGVSQVPECNLSVSGGVFTCTANTSCVPGGSTDCNGC